MAPKRQKYLKVPHFISRNDQQEPPQNRGGFCCIFGFFFLNFFDFFPLFLLISCCFMPSWNPKTEWGYKLYGYIYICAVKLLTGPSLGVFKVISWAKSKLLTGPRSFSHYKIGVSDDLLLLSYHCVCVCFFRCPIIWQFSKNSLFKKRVHFFSPFSVF